MKTHTKTQLQQRKSVIFFFVFSSIISRIFAQASNSNETTLSGNLNWEKMEINVSMQLKIADKNVGNPSYRIKAEDNLWLEYIENIRPFILSIQVDSSSMIGDLINSGLLPASSVDEFTMAARKVPPYYNKDFTAIASSYSIDMNYISEHLFTKQKLIEMMKPLSVDAGISYTGIIIMADEPMPVHGKLSKDSIVPSIFPKIWDSEMNLVFERNMSYQDKTKGSLFVHWSSADKVFVKSPSGIDPELAKIVGTKPLRVIATELFGINSTDLVINKDDAVKMLTSDANRKLLQEGRIAIIIDPESLTRVIELK
ncbi:hypothetical protein FACS1894102_5210 [Spirochaetia bacterium]|nr:hypothetical protein FACS1894102_5210 [Spirochaetia bacterium]